jgi:hypothetical protein
MRTASGATAVNVAKLTNLSAPMIHAFLDNICYISIELNGSTQYDNRHQGDAMVSQASATGTSN